MLKIKVAHKKYLSFACIIIVLGLVLGFIYYYCLDANVEANLIYTLKNSPSFTYNAIIKDLIMMSLILISATFIIGLPLAIFYLFYESLSVSFLICLFFNAFKIKGLFYILIYIIFNKLIPIIIIVFFMYKIMNISRLVVGLIIYKKDPHILNKLIIYFKNSLSLIVIMTFINIFLYFASSFIFGKLAFLIS